MKNKYINDKTILIILFLFAFLMVLVLFNANFTISAVNTEMQLYDVWRLLLIYAVIILVIYLSLFKFVKNKSKLFLIIAFILLAVKVKVIFLFLIPILLFIYNDKNDKINFFLENFVIIFYFVTTFLFLFNGGKALYSIISYNSRLYKYEDKTKIKVSSDERPNIYWIHMDGTPNMEFIEKYYDTNLDYFRDYLKNEEFIVNKNTEFKGAHHTITALNALFNPNYYDDYLKDYLEDYDKCYINNTPLKHTLDFREMFYHRVDNELFRALKDNKYSTISITNYDIYTAMNADYNYDILDLEKRGNINYIGKLKDNKSLSITENLRFSLIASNMLGKDFMKYMDGKKIDYNIRLDKDKYKYISSSDYVMFKAIIKSVEDSRKKDKKSKFYFIDSDINHVKWDFDENGKRVNINNTDLDYFDDNYVFSTKLLMEFVNYIKETDNDSIIIIQGDHGIHSIRDSIIKDYYKVEGKGLLEIRNSTISAIYLPEKYRVNTEYLDNPLNISRYLVNSFVGDNYKYLD